MRIFGYRFHLRLSEMRSNFADRRREELDLHPSMIEWHIRDIHSLNGLR
ncbi:MAG: hypothetical protein K5851_07790 [Lachnospiraceae bacterium]|nr:hypothetical protein [Lachnospiraceae bacterium]